MFTALFTFLGSAALRVAIGHLFDAVTKWQDQRDERARMELQGKLDAEAHARHLDSIKLQAQLGVQVIEAQTKAALSQADAEAFTEAIKATQTSTGVRLIDAWNGAIRPGLATICIGLWVASLASKGWQIGDWDRDLMSMALGLFVGGRIHSTGR